MYTEEAINEPQRRELARRVELYVDPEMEAAYPKHYGSRVEVQFANGKALRSFVLDPHGMPADPVTEAGMGYVCGNSPIPTSVLPVKGRKTTINDMR